MSPVSANFELALAVIAATEHLMVAVDFDGTLAPLVDDPESSRMLPLARSAILDFVTLPETSVTVVSGRALDVLDRLVDLPAVVTLVGSHGAEFRIDGVSGTIQLDAEEQRALAVVSDVVSSVAGRFDGALFEKKSAGAGLHTRMASREDAAEAESEALRRLGLHPENSNEPHPDLAAGLVTVRRGKNILEFSVRSANKGTAIIRLREEAAATATVFIGDDVTDEDAFAVMGPDDMAIKVGEGDSLAPFRLADPAEVAAFLAELVAVRRFASRT